MTNRLQKVSYLFFALVGLILIADTTLIRTVPDASDDRMLTYAILFDFVLVIPLLYWLFMVRPKGKSISRVLFLPLLGALAAWLVLPATMRSMVWHTIWPIELLVVIFEVVFLVYEVRVFYRMLRRLRHVPGTRRILRKRSALRCMKRSAMEKWHHCCFTMPRWCIIFCFRGKGGVRKLSATHSTCSRITGRQARCCMQQLLPKSSRLKVLQSICSFSNCLIGRHGY